MNLIKKTKHEIILLNLAIVFFVFRGSIPEFKYPFLLLYALLIVDIIIFNKGEIISRLKLFSSNYLSVIVSIIVFIASVFLSPKIFLLNIKDIANILVLLSFIYIFYFIIDNKDSLIFFVSSFFYSILFISVLITIYSFSNLFQLISSQPEHNDLIKKIDYNFALLPIFFSITIIHYFLFDSTSRKLRLVFGISLLFFNTNIILSGSKRGIILLFIITLTLGLFRLISFFKKESIISKIGKQANIFLFTLMLIITLTYFFIFHTSFYNKENIIRSLGVGDIANVKNKFAVNALRIASLVDNEAYRPDVYNTIWSSNNPYDPDTWRDTRIHKTIFPLVGDNVEIVPKDVKGYLMDSTCNASYYESQNICESYTGFFQLKVKKGERYQASVYCYISKDCEISNAGFSVGGQYIANNIVYGQTSSNYSLTNKGRWEKLDIDFNCNDGEIIIYLSFTKEKSKDFSKIKGYIIYAYPQIKKVGNSNNPINVAESLVIKQNKNIITSQNSSITYHHPIKKNISRASILPLITLKNLTIPIDSDPIRNWIYNFVSEDSTYYPYKSKLHHKYTEDFLGEDRISRWKFAIEIWIKEYNLGKKFFGGGFSFLNWYGDTFLKDRKATDYPHNPFLHILLYSGIIGVLLYLWLLYYVIYYYIKYIKEYYLLFIFFLITYFFTFFSGGNPFDPPVMGFFMMLPFFIHYIHQKDKSEDKADGAKCLKEKE